MRDYIKCSFKNMGRKKIRSILTISGIAIGVASVILISAIGDIGKSTINNELDSLGIGSISISVNKNVENVQLTQTQLDMISKNELVESAIPVMMNVNQVTMRGLSADSVLWGIGEGAQQVISLTPLYGRLIDQNDIANRANVCVVDESTAKAFYKRENIVGKSLQLVTQDGITEFEIIGVAASGGSLLQNLIGEYVPTFVYIPYSTMQGITGKENFDQIAVKIREEEDTDLVGERLIAELEQKSGVENGYHSENIAKQKSSLNNILNIVTLILSAIAAISLLVAGLGIMTVMLVSVSERTREIGIKKSIGASKLDIMSEFIVEAFILSLLGAIIGCGVGLMLVFAGCTIFHIPFEFNFSLLWFCVLFALGTGILFGSYPAYSASKLKPVDALRHE